MFFPFQSGELRDSKTPTFDIWLSNCFDFLMQYYHLNGAPKQIIAETARNQIESKAANGPRSRPKSSVMTHSLLRTLRIMDERAGKISPPVMVVGRQLFEPKAAKSPSHKDASPLLSMQLKNSHFENYGVYSSRETPQSHGISLSPSITVLSFHGPVSKISSAKFPNRSDSPRSARSGSDLQNISRLRPLTADFSPRQQTRLDRVAGFSFKRLAPPRDVEPM